MKLDIVNTMWYIWGMKPFEWNKTKSEWLKNERNISFEEIAIALSEIKRVPAFKHPNQGKDPGQKVFLVNIKGYAYMVPFVEDTEKIFLKTIFRSRKATRKYLNAQQGEKNGSKNG